MARAFKFLKRTSLSWGAPGEGTGVTEADNGGVVLTGDALAEAPLTGPAGGGVSSCAFRIDALQIEMDETTRRSRVVMVGHFSQRSTLGDAGNSSSVAALYERRINSSAGYPPPPRLQRDK